MFCGATIKLYRMSGVRVASKRKGSKFLVINFITRRKIVRFFGVVILIILLFFLSMKYLVNPVIVKTGKSKIEELSSWSINGAINEVMLGTVCYDDLIHIVTDGNGKIVLLQANSILINSLTQDVVKSTYNKLFNGLYEPLKIPIGSFTGIPAFASLGPVVEIDILPYGNVTCKFLSKFTSQGINQTLHQIYANVETIVNVVLPMEKLRTTNNIEILVAESLIVGDVPSTYLMAEDKSDLLNMVG